MAVQKVFLRVAGVAGDGPGPSLFPSRALPSGHTVWLVPGFDSGGALKSAGPDGSTELNVPLPVECTIVDGVLTHRGEPFVWLTAPDPDDNVGWTWELQWRSSLHFGGMSERIRDFSFRLSAATPEQVADSSYPGVNLAPLFPGVKANSGTPITQGPPGASIGSVTQSGGNLVFTSTSGEVLGTVPMPSVTTGDVDGGAPDTDSDLPVDGGAP